MAQLYIDNSVLGRICKSREFAEGFDKAVVQNPKLPKSYTHLPTSYSLMEFIGLTFKIDDISADDSLSDKIKNAKGIEQKPYLDKYLEQLKQKISEKLDADRHFTIEHIKYLQDKKLSHIEDIDIRKKIKRFIQYGKIDNKELNKMKTCIALDQAYNHNFRKDIKDDVYSLIRIDMVDFIINNINRKSNKMPSIPFSRVMSKLWDYTMKLSKDNPLIKNNREYFDKMTESIHYKGNRDMMDVELVHLAVVGQPHSKNEKDSMYCYTCDDYEQTKKRVLGYKYIIEDAFKSFQRHKPSNLETDFDINANLIMGTIAFCDPDTGEILKTLDIKQMPGIREDIELQSSNHKKSTLKIKNNAYKKLDEEQIKVI